MTKRKTQLILNEARFSIPIVAALMVVLFAALPALAQSGPAGRRRAALRQGPQFVVPPLGGSVWRHGMNLHPTLAA
jgi:hypothetical protein